MKIAGKVGLVTGGANGIGRGVVERLLDNDAKVRPSLLLEILLPCQLLLKGPSNY